MKKVLHVIHDRLPANVIARVADLLAARDGGEVLTCDAFLARRTLDGVGEVIVHGCWLPAYWRCCRKALRAAAALVRMPHGSFSPVYLERQGKWKKLLAAPIERGLFGRCARVIVTCPAERTWCERWGVKGPFEVVDLKRFFPLSTSGSSSGVASAPRPSAEMHVLYLGRLHPLKGVEFLERAVRELNGEGGLEKGNGGKKIDLRIVSDHIGDELERDWAWCDVLCLPSLSENFGLVVAEALARGKRVITTDGAPAWDPSATGTDCGGRLVYLRGYRDGRAGKRIALLKTALLGLTSRSGNW